MSIAVWFAALKRASEGWDAQAEDLHGARNSLLGVDTSLLGTRVAPHAQAFLDTWTAELKSVGTEAEDNSTALLDVKAQWSGVDRATVEATQALLPWTDRDLTPTGEA